MLNTCTRDFCCICLQHQPCGPTKPTTKSRAFSSGFLKSRQKHIAAAVVATHGKINLIQTVHMTALWEVDLVCISILPHEPLLTFTRMYFECIIFFIIHHAWTKTQNTNNGEQHLNQKIYMRLHSCTKLQRFMLIIVCVYSRKLYNCQSDCAFAPPRLINQMKFHRACDAHCNPL